MMEEKTKLLEDFINKYKDLPKQGTKEWEESRGIGGSELYNLITNERRFVMDKTGLLIPFKKNISMKWGNFLEDLNRSISEEIFKTKIYETSSVPSAEVKEKTFSMDGMGVCKVLCDKYFTSNRSGQNVVLNDFLIDMLVLFEFKCPFTYKIKQNDIRKYYLPQVKSGLCDLVIPDVCFYTEAVFRICDYTLLGYNKYFEQWLHIDRPEALPMMWCFIGVYHDKTNPNSNKVLKNPTIKSWIDSGQVDFAKIENIRDFELLIDTIKEGSLNTWMSKKSYSRKELKRCDFIRYQGSSRLLSELYSYDMDVELGEFYKYCRSRNYNPLGVVGVKMFDMNIKPIEKEPGYTKQYEVQIIRAANNIKELKSISDIYKRRSRFNELYPTDEISIGFEFEGEEEEPEFKPYKIEDDLSAFG